MKKLLIVIGGLLVVQVGICFLLFNQKKDKVVYADAIRLFNEYQFKKDMERESQGVLNRLKHEADSVSVIYKVNPNDIGAQQLMAEKQRQLSEGFNKVNKEINEKVWQRLNPKIQEFGKNNNVEMLIGANGMGTVLYADESRDITDALIKYVNENYEKAD
jgi:outer membrane protein